MPCLRQASIDLGLVRIGWWSESWLKFSKEIIRFKNIIKTNLDEYN